MYPNPLKMAMIISISNVKLSSPIVATRLGKYFTIPGYVATKAMPPKINGR